MCGLGDNSHFYVDDINAPNNYQIAESSEEAERNLRSWAGKTVRLGHTHIDLRPIAAKILAAKELKLIKICDKEARERLWIIYNIVR